MEVSSKASDNEDFFDEIYSEEEPSQMNERQNLESFLTKTRLSGPYSMFNMFEDSDLLRYFLITTQQHHQALL